MILGVFCILQSFSTLFPTGVLLQDDGVTPRTPRCGAVFVTERSSSVRPIVSAILLLDIHHRFRDLGVQR